VISSSSWKRIAVYSLPAAGSNFMENLIGMYLLKFTTDVLLLAPALVALFFGLGRVWDAVSDPIVGYWSDRTRHRLGRRRPWILASALPLGLAFVALWSPPDLAPGALRAWVCAAVILFFTAQSALVVPHLAWGAELAGAGHDRTRVFAGRLAVGLGGVFLGALAMGALERSADPRATAFGVAVAAALGVAIACAVTVGRLSERPELQGRGARSPGAAFRDVLRNPHARRLLAVLFLEALGFASMTTTMPFYIQYVMAREGQAALFMGGALGAMLASIPVWLVLARRFGKLRVWLGSLYGRAACFGAVAAVPDAGLAVLVTNMLLIGALFGCGAMLAPAVQADVIDDDERRTGERKEGTYFASWNFAAKASAGAAVILSGAVLQAVAFEPNAVQAPLARSGILMLFGGFPCAFYLLAAALLARLSLYVGAAPTPGARVLAGRRERA
jgi:GPH family glycoside/pentoside/hexuronide:cation symporter